ncbi:MAG: type II toxin-antitoxin system VapC family toxin [Intrasporangium sp.]|uniref:type II toxin-antitoxin system VapC family toxin n=1 Tax=Intrasporangium sp. TaxID=1925024 RepID=UPI0026489C41|nr:type II toxin-antitoxin system VapC family toxin [Intrasporangium sp.]MDN5794569.1 type II toxin-antitoxin system VapC family toxin [Intrasporangium sp.]
MIVDSSALMAILGQEPGWDGIAQAAALSTCRMSTATWLEAGIVADHRSASHGERLNRLVEVLGIELVPVSVQHATVARAAYRRYGRGNGRAALNFGDCFSYALAVTTGEPLMFTGDEFTRTDVVSAL